SNVKLINRQMRRLNDLGDDAVGRKCYEGVCQPAVPCQGCAHNWESNGGRRGRTTLERNGRYLLASFSEIPGPGGAVKYRLQAGTDIPRQTQATALLQELPQAEGWSLHVLARWLVAQVAMMGYTRVCLYSWTGTRLAGWECSDPKFNEAFQRHMLPENDELAREAFRKRRPILIEGERLGKITRERPFPVEDVKRVLKVPLLVPGDRRIGMLCLEADDEELLTQEDVEIMTLLAPAMANSLHLVKRTAEWKQRSDWLEALREIDVVLTTGNRPEEVFQVVVDAITRVL